MTDIILRLREIMRRTGLSRSSIYRLSAEGKFPRSISLGERAVGWLESDVDAWIAERVAKSCEEA